MSKLDGTVTLCHALCQVPQIGHLIQALKKQPNAEGILISFLSIIEMSQRDE